MEFSGWTVRCNESKPCYLKVKNPSGMWGCPILTSGYEDGCCPFAKERQYDLSYLTLMLREQKHDRTGTKGI